MFMYWGYLLLFFSLNLCFFGMYSLVKMNVLLWEYIICFLGGVEIKVFFLFDWMSLFFLFIVFFISSMVIFYSDKYMEGEKMKIYFLYGVLLFVGSMVMMIVSPNLMVILLGWDGLGLVSYCLVIFYPSVKSDKAGMITVLSNRVGDVMILLSIVMVLNFGSLDFYVLKKMMWLVGFFLIVAGMTKSAQIPFSAWLPAAMSAPTPVSSLVHSSTLVTAGVYLLIRVSFLFQINIFSSFLLFFSLLTMLMAGIGAMMETDLKSVIALSTLSQLGLMMMILSVGMSELSFFHLLTHAMFKAMLFLCAGIMIHNSLGWQDIRFMGTFFQSNPLISGMFGLASFSLFGFPFLSGFYSKDLLLEYMYEMELSLFVLCFLLFATVFTCLYSLRLMYYSVWNGLLKSVFSFSPFCFSMGMPVLVMGFFIIFLGSFLMWMIFPEPLMILMDFNLKLLNLGILVFSFWFFFLFYFNFWKGFMGKVWGSFFLGSMWYLSILTGVFPLKFLKGGVELSKMDSSWVEEVGPQGLYSVNMIGSLVIQWIQMSHVSFFLLFMMMLLFFVI
nr:NADH dehydrogenase subunit 5 [Secretargas transgariepinus]QLD97096.1 NADH dehydrogenase subunit 5 [Secretargas transgariepinus]